MPPSASIVRVNGNFEVNRAKIDGENLAESIVKRVGLPVGGRVRTRMSRNTTAMKAGPAEPISTSMSRFLLAMRIAASFARSYGNDT